LATIYTAVDRTIEQTEAITPRLSDPLNKLSNYTVFFNQRDPDDCTGRANSNSERWNKDLWNSKSSIHGQLTGVIPGDGITATYLSSATTSTVVGTYDAKPSGSDYAGARRSEFKTEQLHRHNRRTQPYLSPSSVDRNGSRRHKALWRSQSAFTGTIMGWPSPMASLRRIPAPQRQTRMWHL